MDLQPSQNSHDEGDRLQTSESLSGFFSRMTVSNKTMERIMRQDSNLSPYDGFRIGGIGKVLNQIGLNQRKHHIIYKVSSGEFAIPMEFTGNVMEMQLIPKEEILEELSRLREEVAVTMKWIHIGTIEVVIKATFKEGIDSEIHLSIMDRRINNLRDGCLGTMIEDRITGYKGKEKDLARVLTPQEIRQPVVGRYEGMLEIAGHEFLVAGRENGCMTLGLSFLEDHKPWGRKAYIDSGSGICTAKPGVFPKEARETLPVIAGRDFSQKILILNTGIREAKIMIGGAFGTPWFSKRGDFDAKLTNPKMQDKRKFGKVLLSFRQQGLIDSDSFYEESEEEIKNLRKPWNKIEATLKIKEECKYEYVRYKPIQMNMEDKKDMQIIIKEHISLGLIEPGISAYSSPGFLVRNHGEIKRGKPRKDFRPLLKETESAKWKWEEIHTQRVRELKQVCNNLPKLAIPQDDDELVVYTDANDYRWAAVLMKRLLQGKNLVDTQEGCSPNNKPKCGTSMRRFFAVWKAFKKWPLFLLAKEFTLKVDNTNVKAFLKNKLESK
ncbi:movement protein [Sesamum angolense]|uniref:Movement protein n=1 Tax=Sesamum angolense TaxID=2727404 RepID=A0AAE1WPF7_9LAMI|nr:movement protein [Sesamum angolense]